MRQLGLHIGNQCLLIILFNSGINSQTLPQTRLRAIGNNQQASINIITLS